MIDLEVDVVEEKEIIEDKEIIDDFSGTKSVSSGSPSSTQFRDYIINEFDSGRSILNISVDNYILTIQRNDFFERRFTINLNYFSRVDSFLFDGDTFIKYQLLGESDSNVGIYFYRQANDSESTYVELVPILGEVSGDSSVSGNGIDYTDLLTSIDNRMERIEQNVESISNNVIFIRDGLDNLSGGEACSVTVSENSIMDKYLSDYSVSEALLLFISISILIAGIVVIIKKGVPRWH